MFSREIYVILLMLVSMETVIRPSVCACEFLVVADARCNVGKSACSGYAPVRSVPPFRRHRSEFRQAAGNEIPAATVAMEGERRFARYLVTDLTAQTPASDDPGAAWPINVYFLKKWDRRACVG